MIEIIVNSRSKSSLIELGKIESELKEKKLDYKVLKTSKNRNACDLMDDVVGDNLIVIGGDGTINEVVNNYHGKEFIYLAYGSGNDLAKSLKFDRSAIDRKYKANISWDNGNIHTDQLYLLNVMIQPFEGGGIQFAPSATGKNDVLHVMIMENMNVITFIYNYLCLLMKKHHSLKNVKLITTDKLTVITNQKYFQIDGELVKNKDRLDLSCISKFYKLKRM